MARNEQLIRQHKILQVIERYRFGRTIEELRDDLVAELGLTSLHTRTVRRDLEALQAAGIDVGDHETQRGRVWKFGPGVRGTHKITVSSSELIALSLGRDLLHPLAGTPFWQGIESFWTKIGEELPAGVREHYEKYRRILRVIGLPAKSYERHHGMLSTINRAILEHRVVQVDYQSVGKPTTTRQIEPYAIVFYESSLYIVAAAREIPPGQPRIRHWKLDRFHKVTALDAWFQPDAEFQLEQHLARGMGIFSRSEPREFKVRLSPSAAAWVTEDPWHPDQQLQTRKDGSLVLTVQAAHEMEIIPRVLALGKDAELISPKPARRMIAELVRDMSARYANEEGEP